MSGPGWINTNLQSQIQWRPDDVVISVPAKSGTTWTMNIVYQLREKGNRNFDDIYEELKWIEAMDSPTATEADMIHKIDTFTPHKPRAFKTHSSPPALPFRSDVKYLVVVRNPEEVVVSFKSFAAKHSPDFLRWWGVPPEAFDFPDVDSFYKGFCKGSEFDLGLFKFVEEWMKRRDEPNVMMIHYSDMVKDHEGSIKKIAKFLNYGPYTDQEWEDVLELTSFPWMKKHEMKFEARTIWEVPALMHGAMMRQGSFGLARKEGISDEIAKEIRERGKTVLTDQKMLEWMYNGGDVHEVCGTVKDDVDGVAAKLGEVEVSSDAKPQNISQ